MAITGVGPGRLFHVVHEASGVPLELKRWRAVTFVSFLAAGTQAMTLTQHTDDGTGSPGTESNLATIDTVYEVPGVGGTVGVVTQTAANTYTHADATNDQIMFTVRADELSDDNVFVECTAATGTCIAILHDPVHQTAATSISSPLAV